MTRQQVQKFHTRALLLWICPGLPVSYLLRSSITWVMVLSVYTILVGHFLGAKPEEGPDARTQLRSKLRKWDPRKGRKQEGAGPTVTNTGGYEPKAEGPPPTEPPPRRADAHLSAVPMPHLKIVKPEGLEEAPIFYQPHGSAEPIRLNPGTSETD